MRTRTRMQVALLLAAVAVAWMLRPEGFFDGPVLARLTETHGVHLGDLLSVVLGAAALVLVGSR